MFNPTIEKQKAIAMAQFIVETYPKAKDANEAIFLAQHNGLITDETFMLAVWGRLMRLYSRKVGA